MKKINRISPFFLAILILNIASFSNAESTNKISPIVIKEQEITHIYNQKPIKGSSKNFTGQVEVQPIWSANKDINASGASVTFQPGARTMWHSHPIGQQLVVVSGTGFTQEWGKPIQIIHPGDVVWCPPGIKHWHGATRDSTMNHLAVTGMLNGENVTWMEPVSEAQYNDH